MCFIEHPWTERACLPVCCKKSPDGRFLKSLSPGWGWPQNKVRRGSQHGSRGILMEYSWVLTGYIYIYVYIYNYIYNRIAIPSSNIDTAVDGGWKTTFLFGWRAMISLRCSHSDYVAPLTMTKMTKQWHLTVPKKWWFYGIYRYV